MPHPPLHIWTHPHNWSIQPLYLSTFYTTMVGVLSQNKNKLRIIWTSPTSLAAVSHIQVRPKHGPLAYRSSNSTWGMWTSTVPDAGMATAGTSKESSHLLASLCIWHHSPWWGLLCGLRLFDLQVGRSRWGQDLTLVREKVYLLLPESALVHIRVQERVTITPFEDWVC